jgi:hypothetical protein
MDAGVPVYSIDCNVVTEPELRCFSSSFTFTALFPGAPCNDIICNDISTSMVALVNIVLGWFT